MEIILVAVIFYGGGYLLIKWLDNAYDKHGSLMYPNEKEEKSYSIQRNKITLLIPLMLIQCQLVTRIIVITWI
jgi:aspartyl aminopeptidase